MSRVYKTSKHCYTEIRLGQFTQITKSIFSPQNTFSILFIGILLTSGLSRVTGTVILERYIAVEILNMSFFKAVNITNLGLVTDILDLEISVSKPAA